MKYSIVFIFTLLSSCLAAQVDTASAPYQGTTLKQSFDDFEIEVFADTIQILAKPQKYSQIPVLVKVEFYNDKANDCQFFGYDGTMKKVKEKDIELYSADLKQAHLLVIKKGKTPFTVTTPTVVLFAEPCGDFYKILTKPVKN